MLLPPPGAYYRGGNKFYFLMSTNFLEYFFAVMNEYQNDYWWKSIFGWFTGGSQIANFVKIGQFWQKMAIWDPLVNQPNIYFQVKFFIYSFFRPKKYSKNMVLVLICEKKCICSPPTTTKYFLDFMSPHNPPQVLASVM